MSDQPRLWEKPTDDGRCPNCGQKLPETKEEDRRERLRRIRSTTISELRALLRERNNPRCRADDPPSSKLAAWGLVEQQPTIRLRLVLQAILLEREDRPYCSDHLGRGMGLDPDQFSSQVSELKKAGILHETGVMLETARGNPCMELALSVRLPRLERLYAREVPRG